MITCALSQGACARPGRCRAIPVTLRKRRWRMSSTAITTQVPHGAGEPAPRRCLRCCGERMEPGGLAARGGLSFYPANSTFWTLQPKVAIQAFLCMDCGTVELVGDVQKAEALVGRAKSQ